MALAEDTTGTELYSRHQSNSTKLAAEDCANDLSLLLSPTLSLSLHRASPRTSRITECSRLLISLAEMRAAKWLRLISS